MASLSGDNCDRSHDGYIIGSLSHWLSMSTGWEHTVSRLSAHKISGLCGCICVVAKIKNHASFCHMCCVIKGLRLKVVLMCSTGVGYPGHFLCQSYVTDSPPPTTEFFLPPYAKRTPCRPYLLKGAVILMYCTYDCRFYYVKR